MVCRCEGYNDLKYFIDHHLSFVVAQIKYYYSSSFPRYIVQQSVISNRRLRSKKSSKSTCLSSLGCIHYRIRLVYFAAHKTFSHSSFFYKPLIFCKINSLILYFLYRLDEGVRDEKNRIRFSLGSVVSADRLLQHDYRLLQLGV